LASIIQAASAPHANRSSDWLTDLRAQDDQSAADPVSALNRGFAKSIGEGRISAGVVALSVQARQSMSRSIAAPAVVCV
jgi:hypothetical protein